MAEAAKAKHTTLSVLCLFSAFSALSFCFSELPLKSQIPGLTCPNAISLEPETLDHNTREL
jgi:hypothetical protein